MSKIFLIFFLVSTTKLIAQTDSAKSSKISFLLEEVSKIPDVKSNEVILKAKEILKLDSYNRAAHSRIIGIYKYQKQLDSIPKYFQRIIARDSLNPRSYFLRVQLGYERFGLKDTAALNDLKKIAIIDSTFLPAFDRMGDYYYKLFNEQYKSDSTNTKALQYFAKNSIKCKTKLTVRYPIAKYLNKYEMIQCYNYLNLKAEAIAMEDSSIIKSVYENKITPDSVYYYFPIEPFLKCSVNWRTNFNVDMYKTTWGPMFMNTYYKWQLRALKELPIFLSKSTKTIYRLSWLRTFHHPVVIRVEKDSTNVKLFWKESDGSSYNPGKIILDRNKTLENSEWENFLNLLAKAEFDSMPTVINRDGYDGAEWILEELKNNKYHIVSRWSPEKKSPYRELCTYLIKLTKVDRKPFY